MYIYAENMNLITKQDTDVDCLELAEFTASKAGTYKVEIVEKVLEEILIKLFQLHIL